MNFEKSQIINNYASLVHLIIFVRTENQLFNAKWLRVKLKLEKIWIVYYAVVHTVNLLTA